MNYERYIGVLIADPESGVLSEPDDPCYERLLRPDNGIELIFGRFAQDYTVYGTIITDAIGRIIRVVRLTRPAIVRSGDEVLVRTYTGDTPMITVTLVEARRMVDDRRPHHDPL